MPATLRDAPSYASLTSVEFEHVAESSVKRMLARQAAFDTEWFPDGFRSWTCDQAAGVIRFLKADGTGIEAPVQILGSYAKDSETWEWSWNNPHVNAELAHDASSARDHARVRGYAPLTTGIVRASLHEARRMLAVAVGLVDAPAVYWGATGTHVIAMIYRDPRPISKSARAPEGEAADARSSANDDEDDRSALGLLLALLWWIPSMILDLVFGVYYRGPLALKRSKPTRYGMAWMPLSAERAQLVAPYLLEDLTEIEQAVVSRGFSIPLRLEVALTEEATRISSLFESGSEGTLGFAFVAANQHTGVSRTTTFETRFADGIRLFTSNSEQILMTPPRPNARSVRLPAITDIARLHDIHRFRVREHAATAAVIPRTRGADPIAYTEAETRETQDHWVQCGYYRRTSQETLVYTWRGATLAAWRYLFPWKQITKLRHAREAAALLRRFEGGRQ
jgi:hypothetical protein